jgi:8-amino-7-oxononanoate synthase
MSAFLQERLDKRKVADNLRELQLFHNLIDFSSNDYLGLARSPHFALLVTEEWKRETKLGATGSRLLTGNSLYAQDLENRIAHLHGFEAGLLFNCGYMANVGLLSSIAEVHDTIFFDARVHASTHDGIRLSRARTFPFRHNDAEHLERRLKNCSSEGERFICVESIYSTDGSRAPLVEIAKLSREYGAHLIVDEAHAMGVCGKQGLGLVAEYGLSGDLFAQVTTFGKALGVSGAIVLGTPLLKQLLINFATPFIYTTALPFPTLAAIKCSYALFPTLEKERQHLNRLIEIFRHAYPDASHSPIQSIPICGNASVKHIAKELVIAGFDVRALTSPTVQKGSEMLRICLHAFNTEKELTELLERLVCYV